jgi:hypothetical protein
MHVMLKLHAATGQNISRPKKHLQHNTAQTLTPKTNIRTVVRKKETAFRSRLLTLVIENTRKFIDMEEFLRNTKIIVFRNIRK